MAYPRKIVKFMDIPGSISQVYHSGLQYALVSDADEQACPFVYCKDFFQDAYQGFYLGETREIYGFRYNPAEHKPLSTNSLKLMVLNAKDPNFHQKITAAHDFLIQIERAMKMRQKTQVFEVRSPPEWVKLKKMRVFVFKGNRRWLASPVMISLYTLLLRCGFTHTLRTPYKKTINELCEGKKEPYQVSDKEQLIPSLIGLSHIIKTDDQKIFGENIEENFPQDVPIGTMHNHMGIVSYSSGYCKTRFPKWYEDFQIPVVNPFAKDAKTYVFDV